MKSIIITSFHSIISRNILSTPVISMLVSLGDVRVVIVCPNKKKIFFEEEFKDVGVFIESIEIRLSWRDMFMRYLALSAINTRTLYNKRRTEFKGRGKILSYFIANKAGRALVRFFNSIIIPRHSFEVLFEKYKPTLIFSTDIQNEYDIRLMVEARNRGVSVISMVRSWDNLTSKGLVRFIPQKLLVHSSTVGDEAVRLQGIPRENVEIVGIPHYDFYTSGQRTEREPFFKRIGGDPSKKTLLFVPIGDRFFSHNTVDREVLEIIDKNLPNNFQILVRFPPADNVRELETKKNYGRIIFDRPSTRFEVLKDTELSKKDDEHLADSLYYSDLIVSGLSTMCIDGCVFNKPVILVGFDGYNPRPYFESIRRCYDYDHFKPILESGGVRYAQNPGELVHFMKYYIEDPGRDRIGREKVVALECFKVDGKSSERLAKVLISQLNTLDK